VALHTIELDAATIHSIKMLHELIDKFHRAINSHKIPSHKLTAKIRFALAMGAACCEYSESIAILCSQRKSKSCGPLLRPLLEGRISLIYILGVSDDTRLDAALVSDLTISKATLEHLIEFTNTHNLEGLENISNEQMKALVKRKIEDIRTLSDSLLSGNNPEFNTSARLPALYSRAKKIDSDNNIEPQKSFFLNCLMVYAPMSGAIHLGMDGLSDWILETDNKLELNASETLENAYHTTLLTFILFGSISLEVFKELSVEHGSFSAWLQQTIAAIEVYDSKTL
jgi:hypothetical protein